MSELTKQPARDELVLIVQKMGVQMTRMHASEALCMSTQNNKADFNFETLLQALCT